MTGPAKRFILPTKFSNFLLWTTGIVVASLTLALLQSRDPMAVSSMMILPVFAGAPDCGAAYGISLFYGLTVRCGELGWLGLWG